MLHCCDHQGEHLVMASLLIRNLSDETKRALRMRAARNGVSMEEEVRQILGNALAPSGDSINLADGLLQRFAGMRGDDDLHLPTRQCPRPAPRLGE